MSLNRINYDEIINKVMYTNLYKEPYIITEIIHMGNGKHNKCNVKYINTGNEKIYDIYKALQGSILDHEGLKYKRTMYGVGYIGDIDNVYSDPEKHLMHDKWKGIMSRCYNKKDIYYNSYGGIGVSVGEDWQCFATFFYDMQKKPLYKEMISTRYMYHIDKDTLQLDIPPNNRVYSNKTCIIIPNSENNYLRMKERKNEKSSKYYGVFYSTERKAWCASIYANGKNIGLGRFESEEAAAKVRDYYVWYYKQNNPLNNVDMDIGEALSYKRSKPKKMMTREVIKND